MHRSPFQHGHDDGRHGASPIAFQRAIPGGRQRANCREERLARCDVVFGPSAPMNMLRAEVSKRLTECAHFVQIPDDERNGGFEMTLEEGQVTGKQRAQIGRYGKELSS